MKKIKVIILDRAEGPNKDCYEVCFDSWDAWDRADKKLLAWSATAPEGGCYNKVDFDVTWEDGESYAGCYYMGRAGEDGEPGHSLVRHVRRQLEFVVHRTSCKYWTRKKGYPKEEVLGHVLGDYEDKAKKAQAFLREYVPSFPSAPDYWCCKEVLEDACGV